MRNVEEDGVILPLEAVAGVDVAKQVFNVYVIEPVLTKRSVRITGHYRTFQRTTRGIADAVDFMGRWEVRRAVMESTSVYHLNIFHAFMKEGITTYVVNAGLVQLKGKPSKRDKLDAQRLAELLYRGEISTNSEVSPSYIPCDVVEQALRKITRACDQTSRDLSRLKNRVHKLFDQYGMNLRTYLSGNWSSINFHLFKAIINKETYSELLERVATTRVEGKPLNPSVKYNIGKRETQITQLLEEAGDHFNDIDLMTLETLLVTMERLKEVIDYYHSKTDFLVEYLPPKLNKRFQIATSMIGVSDRLAIRIVVEYGELSRFPNRRKAGSYTGLEPRVQSSGGRSHMRGITRSGNKHLRRHLYIAARGAINHNPKWKQYYKHLRKRGRKYNQAVCAIARKIGVQYYLLAKKGEVYDKDRHRMKMYDESG